MPGFTCLVRRFSPEAQGLHGEDGLDALLHDAAIDAVAVILPVQVMLQVCGKSCFGCSNFGTAVTCL